MRTGFDPGPMFSPGATAQEGAPRPGLWLRRRTALADDLADLLGRSVIYALAVLGLLHVLGLVAAAP
jgi:hypothetical protein